MANLTNSAKLIAEMEKKANLTDLPDVYNSTVTVVVNGNTGSNTFSTNQSSNSTLKVTVGKSDVGLGNVDNTSDANKPISTATQAALDLKADKSEISSVFKYKGSKANYDALPSSGNVTGDVWNIEAAHTTAPVFPAGSNLAWDGSAWDVLGGTVDLSGYQTTANLKTSLSDNSDTYYPSQKAVKTAVDAKANTSDVLTKTNTTSFTPTGDYQPATKKYVDDNVGVHVVTISSLSSSSDGADVLTAINNYGFENVIVSYSYTDQSGDLLVTRKYYPLLENSDTETGNLGFEFRVMEGSTLYKYTVVNLGPGLNPGVYTEETNLVSNSELNTKTFYLSSTSDLTTAQAAYDWYLAGKNPIIVYGDAVYTLYSILSGQLVFRSTIMGVNDDDNNGYSYHNIRKLSFVIPGGAVTNIIADYNSVPGDFLRTGKNYTIPYTPQYDGSPATKKYVDDNIITYNAGPGISILNGDDYSAMRGPCDSGFHVPTKTDFINILNAGATIGAWTITNSDRHTPSDDIYPLLKRPKAGRRESNTGNVSEQGSKPYWRCNSKESGGAANASDRFGKDGFRLLSSRTYGYNIRPIKDTPSIPDSGWTTLYDGSSTATGAGIFHNSTAGLISISADGSTWYTISDKNLGATTVWNNGDTLSQSNCGNYYQWGNNYGFPYTGNVTTSATTVSTTGYGPGNYYSSSTFITGNDWSNPSNDNLRGMVTGKIQYHNAITNIGGDVTVSSESGNVLSPGAKLWTGDETNMPASLDQNTLYFCY